jgi:23S rRNA A2030 N6-methylase RlmJ
MLVVNPPYRFDAEAEAIVAWLASVLAADGGCRVRWLVPE